MKCSPLFPFVFLMLVIILSSSLGCVEALKLQSYELTQRDIERGLLSPLDKAMWIGDIEAFRRLEKTGKYQSSDVLNVQYSSAEEAYYHYRSVAPRGPIYAALRANDVNAVSLLLELCPSHGPPTINNLPIFNDPQYGANGSRWRTNTVRIKRFLSAITGGKFPKESAEIFLAAGAIDDFPVIFLHYNLDLMELGLKYGNWQQWHWAVHEISGEFAYGKCDCEMAVYRRYLEIKSGDSEELIYKKTAMHALLKKYGYPY